MPKIVIITGGIASGKTTVASIFEKFNIKVIDTDEISHRITKKNGQAIDQLNKQFDKNFFNNDGSLNRKKIRLEVFRNPSMKSKLESVLHPIISEVASLESNQASSPYVIQVVPLWAEINKKKKLQAWKVIVVDCNDEIQKMRALRRSSIDADTFDVIKKNQVSRKARLLLADFVIRNNGSLHDLNDQCVEIHSQLLKNL
tara:strand:+ start:994 stop:1593 length:600 start_codon:yes stop_codon:yes gene_type:complete